MTDLAPPQSCSRCGAPLAARATSCEFCGTEARPLLSDEELKRACRTFIEAIDKDMSELASPRVVIGFLAFFISIPVAYFTQSGSEPALWRRWS